MPASVLRAGCPAGAGAATSGPAHRRPSYSRRCCCAARPRGPGPPSLRTHNTTATAHNFTRLTTAPTTRTSDDQSLHNLGLSNAERDASARESVGRQIVRNASLTEYTLGPQVGSYSIGCLCIAPSRMP